MQLTLQQLTQHLKGALAPVYLISGDVPLLRQEARDAVRQAAHQAGYQPYQRLDVEAGFQWSQLTYLANSTPLFAEQTIIEVHNPAAKFDAEAGKTLLAYCEAPPADKLLLMISAKLTGAQQNTRWYKRIRECGAVIPVWPVKPQELPQWIQNRLKKAGIRADAAGIRLLAELTEGNLLATQQAITKLGLLYPDQPIGLAEMSQVISDSAQFNVFELGQYILQGDGRGVLRVLHHLRATDTEPALVLWLVARECRELLNRTEQKQPMNISKLKQLLLACHDIDKRIKGVAAGDVWSGLTQISLQLAGVECPVSH